MWLKNKTIGTATVEPELKINSICIMYLLLNKLNLIIQTPLIFSREVSDVGLHAKVSPHEGILASGARRHHLLFAALLTDLVTLQSSVYY